MIRYLNIIKKRSTCIIAGIVLFVCSVWGAVAPLLIYALPPSLLKARTIAELILTLFAGAGTPTVSPIVMPAIEASVGTDAYTFESLIEEGILQPVDSSLTTEQAIELLGTGNQLQQPFNLDAEAWRTYVEGNWSQMQEYGIDAMLRFQEIANTDSVYGAIDNLGQLALDVGNYGFLGASNAISVLANPGTIVQLGFDQVLDSIKEVFGDKISNGIGIDNYKVQNKDGMPLVGTYVLNYGANLNYKSDYGVWSNHVKAKALWGSGTRESAASGGYGMAVLSDEQGGLIHQNTLNLQYSGSTQNASPNSIVIITDKTFNAPYKSFLSNNSVPLFPTKQDAIDYLNAVKSGDGTNLLMSPDMANPVQGMINDLDSVEPIVDAGKGIDLIPYDDYLPYANNVNDNIHNNEYEDIPGDTYSFVENYVNEVAEPEIPGEEWQNPEIPGTRPIIPDAPVLPENPEISPEVQGQALSSIPTGLEEIFPFCIPWDIYAMVKGLEISRQAPHIIWTFESDLFGFSYTFDIDLAEYDDAAEILRLLELILFIIGLALVTRQIIGA